MYTINYNYTNLPHRNMTSFTDMCSDMCVGKYLKIESIVISEMYKLFNLNISCLGLFIF